MTDRIRATYLVETPLAVERAAAALASEGSTGTFVEVPGERGAVRERFGTKLEAVEPLPPGEAAALLGRRSPSKGIRINRARVTIAVPLDLTGTDLTSVLACLAGNVFELSEVTGLRLLDVALPPALIAACPRPRFGVAGTRSLADVHDRPLFGSIIRPAVGLRPDETAAAVRMLLDAGIDFVKDDELLASPSHGQLDERIAAVMCEIERHADRTGRRAMFAFSITDEPSAMLRHAERVVAAGGACVQVNLQQAGLTAVANLRRHAEVAIHGHRCGFAMLTRSPSLGMSFSVWQQLWRLVGVDQLVVLGLRNRQWQRDEPALAALRQCLTPLLDDDDRALPVMAGGQSSEQIAETFARGGSRDWLHLAGAGVTEHPDGPAAGVRALHEAWEAARGHAAGAL